jgi:hypothetical protein
VVGALAIAAIAVVGIVVAMLGWVPRSRQPTMAEWWIQGALLLLVAAIVAARISRKS